MNAKAKGARAELELAHWMEKHGWAFTKSGASLGMLDLVCFGPGGRRVYVQCKSNARIPRKERVQLETFFVEKGKGEREVILEAVRYDKRGWKFWWLVQEGPVSTWAVWEPSWVCASYDADGTIYHRGCSHHRLFQ